MSAVSVACTHHRSDVERSSKGGRGLASDSGLWANQDAGLYRVHIRFCGYGCYWFRFYSGSLLEKSPECRPSQK
ncbi:hypothetical protein [Pseudomonas sp. 37 R 15]|nr:hypothetical protein [Pseudomonas sp. 37 R 15]